jgi:hypothetical protein
MKKLLTILLATFILISSAQNSQAKLPEYVITIKNHKFSPKNLEVPSGLKFRLIVKNLDSTPEEFESDDLNREKIIAGNKKAYFFIRPLKKGTYKYFGEFNPKTAQGTITAK